MYIYTIYNIYTHTHIYVCIYIYIYNGIFYIYIYIMEYYSVMRKKEILPFATA